VKFVSGLKMSDRKPDSPVIPANAGMTLLRESYRRLAFAEERDTEAEFGADYARYRAVTPAFWPTFPRMQRK